MAFFRRALCVCVPPLVIQSIENVFYHKRLWLWLSNSLKWTITLSAQGGHPSGYLLDSPILQPSFWIKESSLGDICPAFWHVLHTIEIMCSNIDNTFTAVAALTQIHVQIWTSGVFLVLTILGDNKSVFLSDYLFISVASKGIVLYQNTIIRLVKVIYE